MKEKIENSLTLDEVLGNKKYTVDSYQREYRWGKKQIEQLVDDLTCAFEDSFASVRPTELEDVEKFDYYYMGTIIVTGNQNVQAIIDGQQRLTSMTLLLMALNNLHKRIPDNDVGFDKVDNLVCVEKHCKKSFNISVDEWAPCMNALFNGEDYNPELTTESVQNICKMYGRLIELLSDYFDNDGDRLSYFTSWVMCKTLFIKITTPSKQDAHKVFVSMNDRGLSLNPSEMLKGYLLSEIKDDNERNKANALWKETVFALKQSAGVDSEGVFTTEDVTFISTWIRAKYAMKIREGKKDAKDQDYEIIGREFHEWVRQNHSNIGLVKSEDYKNFITVQFKFYANIYLRLKKYSDNYTKGFEEVFYNADKELNYQIMFIMAALDASDSEEIISKKIKMVASYIDCYSTRRLFHFAKINWNTNKSDLFATIKSIRGMSLAELTTYLTNRLDEMDLQLNGLVDKGFSWNQFTGRYILHLLARFTDYVDVCTGNDSLFDSYVNRKVKNSYDREHVLPDKFEDYSTQFSSKEEFDTFRWKIGNLILLKLDKNRSYQAMKYSEKRELYLTNNIIAQSFHEKSYEKNPKFNAFIKEREYGFKAYPIFGKDQINERQELYQKMAYDIWSSQNLRNISGEWSDDLEKAIYQKKIESSSCVDLITDKMNLLTNKKPFVVEFNGERTEVQHYSEVVGLAVKLMNQVDHDRLIKLAMDKFGDRISYSESNEIEGNPSSKWTPSGVDNVFFDAHGSGKEHGQFIKILLEEFGVPSFKLYLK